MNKNISNRHPREVWHSPKEFPERLGQILAQIQGAKRNMCLTYEIDGIYNNTPLFFKECKVMRWAYVSDLLPDEE